MPRGRSASPSRGQTRSYSPTRRYNYGPYHGGVYYGGYPFGLGMATLGTAALLGTALAASQPTYVQPQPTYVQPQPQVVYVMPPETPTYTYNIENYTPAPTPY